MSNLLRITNKIEALGIWDSIPSDSINSVVIEFEFAEDWKNLLCVAQFTQGEKTYNVVIENNRCVLPTELKIGTVVLSVYGTKTDGTPFRETSIPFCFEIYDAGFSSTAETPIPPTPDLYEQLIDKFAHSSGVAALNGKTGEVDIVADEGISVDDTETGKIKIKSTAKITVDTEMSETSENPVQNKVVKGYVDNIATQFNSALDNKIDKSDETIAKKTYVDQKTQEVYDEAVKKLDTVDGGTVSGNVKFTGDVIVQNAPTAPKSAVNKEYADSLKTVIDAEFSDTSENPVQNKVIYENFLYLQDDFNSSLSALQDQIDEKNPQMNGKRLFYTKTTEEVKAITISSKGEPWKLKEFYLGIYIPASPELNSLDYIQTSVTASMVPKYKFTGRTVITGGTLGNFHRYIVFAHTGNGFWRFNSGISLNTEKPENLVALNCISDGMGIVTYVRNIPEEQLRAKEITISTTSTTATFPIGTEIEVYGI